MPSIYECNLSDQFTDANFSAGPRLGENVIICLADDYDDALLKCQAAVDEENTAIVERNGENTHNVKYYIYEIVEKSDIYWSNGTQ